MVQAENNVDMWFKIIETGGRPVKSLLQRSNTTATALPAREAGAQEDTAGGTMSPTKLSVDCVKQKEYICWGDCQEPVHKRERAH